MYKKQLAPDLLSITTIIFGDKNLYLYGVMPQQVPLFCRVNWYLNKIKYEYMKKKNFK